MYFILSIFKQGTAMITFVDTRVRCVPRLPFEESECRALLLKEWSCYKQTQHRVEMEAVGLAVEAKRDALEELRLE
ncbi:39S ribosomal protein L40, mitochondrial-like [Salvelinus namaycush]|uniref:Large ribosomal subunit protein mL40 n=1 Tax=Salvelinus namaycush TaxID=8040 RepID=A0A8U0U005_SALNM|nr:39S ribosomal protein L40, mitochondrial-like [Salvelinus namaycush]